MRLLFYNNIIVVVTIDIVRLLLINSNITSAINLIEYIVHTLVRSN